MIFYLLIFEKNLIHYLLSFIIYYIFNLMVKPRDSLANLRKLKNKENPKPKSYSKFAQKVYSILSYLLIHFTIFGIYYYKVLIIKEKELFYHIFSIILFILGLISYFIVSFSDPGVLRKEIKIDEETIKSYEERDKSHEDSIIENPNFSEPDSSCDTEGNNNINSPVENESNNINENPNYIQRFNTSTNKRKLSLNNQSSNVQIYQNVQTEYFSDSNRNSIYNLGKMTNPTNLKNENLSIEHNEVIYNNLVSKSRNINNNLIFHSRNGSTVSVSSNNQNIPLIKESSGSEVNLKVDAILPVKEPQKEEIEASIEPTYCIKCYIDTPIRAKHCKSCLKCIATFDHHCDWLANCIGERNKRQFVGFLIIHCVELFFFIPITLLNFEKVIKTDEWFYLNYPLIIILFFKILFLTFIFSMLKFQIEMIVKNQSTWENYSWHKINYMVKLTKSQKSPFNKGLRKNLSFVFCYKKYHTRIDEHVMEYIDWKQYINV